MAFMKALKPAILFLVILFAISLNVSSASDDLARFDLSIAGYSLGMTYDEASEVRPFEYAKEIESEVDITSEMFAGCAKKVFVDNFEVDLCAYFVEGRIHKVIVRLPPPRAEEVYEFLKEAYGNAEDNSRVVLMPGGGEMKQTLYSWIFPEAKVDLMEISTNTEYATLALMPRFNKTDLENTPKPTP